MCFVARYGDKTRRRGLSELASCKTLENWENPRATSPSAAHDTSTVTKNSVPHATDAEIRKQTLHRLRHRDGDRRRRVRAGHLQARRLDRELVLDDRLTPLRRYSRLLEDRRLESGRL